MSKLLVGAGVWLGVGVAVTLVAKHRQGLRASAEMLAWPVIWPVVAYNHARFETTRGTVSPQVTRAAVGGGAVLSTVGPRLVVA